MNLPIFYITIQIIKITKNEIIKVHLTIIANGHWIDIQQKNHY